MSFCDCDQGSSPAVLSEICQKAIVIVSFCSLVRFSSCVTSVYTLEIAPLRTGSADWSYRMTSVELSS